MNRRQLVLHTILAATVATLAAQARAQNVPRGRPERAYRDDLLTDDERGRFQLDMRNARTDRERNQIRNDYRTRADQRAPIGTNYNVPPYRAPAGGWPGATTATPSAPEIGVPGATVTGVPQTGVTPAR